MRAYIKINVVLEWNVQVTITMESTPKPLNLCIHMGGILLLCTKFGIYRTWYREVIRTNIDYKVLLPEAVCKLVICTI